MTLQRFSSLRPSADLPLLTALLESKQPPGDRDPSASPLGWFSISNISMAEAEVYIYDEIGKFGVSASEFANELRGIKANKITLHINSPGGNVFDGITIYNTIVNHKATVAVIIDGVAASAASFVAMAGDEVVMAPHSQMMIHEAQGIELGAADDMRKMADVLDKSSDNIASIYAQRTGGSTEEWRARMKDETWFSDSEAVEVGLADRVDGEDGEVVAARMAARAEAKGRVVNVDGDKDERKPVPLGILQALQKGTSDVVRKETLPDFDFLELVKEGTAQAA